MSSVNKIIGSAVHASQEMTLTLANLNFDFAVEERGRVGKRPSREEAESGTSHTTARKLGALFEGELPDAPYLISAYGKRVTEIAERPQSNPKGTVADGAFADHVGADGTSIWAAATSGKNAIAVHLLACMLARIWKQDEAISIWTEFVKRRISLLREKVSQDESFPAHALWAASANITRDQLAEWDSSARAWLRTADAAMRLRQKQLRLIIDNLNFVVSSEGGVHESVMTSWTTAMTAMDMLVAGSPLVIRKGSLLIALSAWHLYPDISVQCAVSRFVQQGDVLVKPGGILTVGLHHQHDIEDNGVYWSLPLAHSRFYGKPISRTGTSGITGAQVSFDEFLCVVLGAVFSTWRLADADTEGAVQLILDLATKMPKLEWLSTLGKAAQGFLACEEGVEKEDLIRLLSYGKRRCTNFLAPAAVHPPPVFGVTRISLLLKILRPLPGKTTIETQVEFLRRWATMSGHKMDGAVIRYFVPYDYESSREGSMLRGPSARHANLTNVGVTKFTPGVKRPRDWESVYENPNDYVHWREEAWEENRHLPDAQDDGLPGAYTLLLPPDPGPYSERRRFDFFFGDPSTAAIYRPSRHAERSSQPRNKVRPKDLLRLLGHGLISELLLQRAIEDGLRIYIRYIQSLRAVQHAASVYQALDEAKVDLKVLSKPLDESSFARLHESTRQAFVREGHVQEMSDTVKAFCCIALFETGGIDIDPSILQRAIAISYADSIFVAQKILVDPFQKRPHHAVKRIIGNIGKPGIAVLVPPPAPEMSEIRPESWKFINHAPFDGRYEDHFTTTSLHLRFTGYELPINTGEHGKIDHPAYIRETVVSAYDRGEEGPDRGPPYLNRQLGRVSGSSNQPAIVRASGNAFARLALVTVAAQRGYHFNVIDLDSHQKPEYDPRTMRSPSVGKDQCGMPGDHSTLDLEAIPTMLDDVIDSNIYSAAFEEESEFDSDSSSSSTTSDHSGRRPKGAPEVRPPSADIAHSDRSPSPLESSGGQHEQPILYIC